MTKKRKLGSLFKYSKFCLKGGRQRKEFYLPNYKGSGRECWQKAYSELREIISSPIHNQQLKIQEDWGHFGKRHHPTDNNLQAHFGIYAIASQGTLIQAVAPGELFYSTQHLPQEKIPPREGKFVILRHPQIQSQEGAQLFSLYMHLRLCRLGYNIWQKMLRRISSALFSKKVNRASIIGELGATGNAKTLEPHLHLQLEFRLGNKILVINPEKILKTT